MPNQSFMDGNNFEITVFNYPLIWDMILAQFVIGEKNNNTGDPNNNDAPGYGFKMRKPAY